MHPKHRHYLRLFLHIVVTPLLLAGIAWWLLHDSSTRVAALPSRDQALAQRARLEVMKADVQSGKTKTIEARSSSSSGGSARPHLFSGPAAIAELDKAIARIDNDVLNRSSVYAWAQPLARTALGSSLLALGIGVGGVMLAFGAGQAARRSRETLAAVFDRTRRALPWLLAAMLLALTIACALLTAAAALYFYDNVSSTQWRTREGKLELGAILLGLVITGAGVLALSRVRRSFAVFDPVAHDQWGRCLDPTQAPGLWRLVNHTAAVLGARPPQNVVVGLLDSFYVTANDVRLLPEGTLLRGQTLYLPLSDAALLREGELECIVGHELAHFSGDDVRYSLRFMPMYAGVARTIAAVGERDDMFSPAKALGRLMLDRVHHAVAHWSRVRELAADKAGARIGGTRAAACALIRTRAVDRLAGPYFGEVLRRPESAPGDIVLGLLEHARCHGLVAPDLHAEVADAHPTDSHPPTADRVRALGFELSDDLIVEACAPCDDDGVAVLDRLLVDRIGLQRQLSAELAAAAVGHQQAVKAELEALVDDAAQPVELRENTATMRVVSAGGAVFMLALGLGMAWFSVTQNLPVVAAFAGGVGVVSLIAFTGISMWWARRGKTPVATLTRTGLSSRSLGGELTWSAVDDMTATVINGATVDVFLQLAPGAAVPQLVDTNLRRFRWIPKKRALRARMINVNGCKPHELLELIQRYRRGAYAQAALADLAAPAAAWPGAPVSSASASASA